MINKELAKYKAMLIVAKDNDKILIEEFIKTLEALSDDSSCSLINIGFDFDKIGAHIDKHFSSYFDGLNDKQFKIKILNYNQSDNYVNYNDENRTIYIGSKSSTSFKIKLIDEVLEKDVKDILSKVEINCIDNEYFVIIAIDKSLLV